MMASELKTFRWFRAGPERLLYVRWIAILAAILFCGALHATLPLTLAHWHNILQHLYYLPIVFAGMYFGWRGGLFAGLMAGVSSLPYTNADDAGRQLADIIRKSFDSAARSAPEIGRMKLIDAQI